MVKCLTGIAAALLLVTPALAEAPNGTDRSDACLRGEGDQF